MVRGGGCVPAAEIETGLVIAATSSSVTKEGWKRCAAVSAKIRFCYNIEAGSRRADR